ncbi:hypothetical protein ACOSP7_004926 [Xanthoceras sorbifolium]
MDFGVQSSSSASFIWHSILWGREIIEQVSRWSIGGGQDISIYNDRWIPRPSTFKVCSVHSLPEQAVVSSLKLPSGSWNKEFIAANFLPHEADLILGLPSLDVCSPNILSWSYDRFGQYTVKSGYWFASNSLERASSSDGFSFTS